ncbi:MAG TPA: hypothetical protein VGE36_13830 [Roseateles sp.]
MSTQRLNVRGANAKPPARLPSLQALRVADPQVQKAVEALREWIEVRLGSRGDPFERAVTARDLEQALAPLKTALAELDDAGLVPLVATLPPIRQGASVQLGDDLYYCNGKAWRKVTLV